MCSVFKQKINSKSNYHVHFRFMAENNSSDGLQKILFVNSPQHNLAAISSYLKKRGYNVTSEQTVEKALATANEHQPDFTFVAWDHPDQKIYQTAENISKITSSLVVPYITSAHSHDVMRLMQSNAVIKMQTPISGPAVQRLILKYEKDKKALQEAQKKNFKALNTEVKNQQTIVLKGERSELMQSEQDGPKIIHSLGMYDSIIDLTAPQAMAFWKNGQTQKLSILKKNKLSEHFDNDTQNKIADVIETINDEKLKDNLLGKKTVYALLIESPDCSGCLVFYSDWEMEQYLVESPIAEYVKVLSSLGNQNHNIQSKLFPIEASSIKNLHALSTNSDFCKQFTVEEKVTMLAYNDIAKNPISKDTLFSTEYIKIDLEAFLPQTTINFDVFLNFKENRKLLKYLKCGSLIDQKIIDKLNKFQHNDLLTTKASEYDWYKYFIESLIIRKTNDK